MSHPARCTRAFPSRRPYAACLHITSLLPFFLASYWGALALGVGIVRLLHTERLASSAQGFGYFPAGVPGVFAFPGRRENSVSNGKKIVNLFFVKWQIIFKYKKTPSVKQRGRCVLNANIT